MQHVRNSLTIMKEAISQFTHVRLNVSMRPAKRASTSRYTQSKLK